MYILCLHKYETCQYSCNYVSQILHDIYSYLSLLKEKRKTAAYSLPHAVGHYYHFDRPEQYDFNEVN